MLVATYMKAAFLSIIRPRLTSFIHRGRSKSFTAAMTEALDQYDELKKDMEPITSAAKKELKRVKELKRSLVKRKWVQYEDESSSVTNDSEIKRPSFDPVERVKRKKAAIVLGYSGVNYFGMQRNPGMKTIEEELLKVMLKHNWITADSFEQPQIAGFQRAARTDKGVSAARQVCSLKLPSDTNIAEFNKDLPDDIRLFGVKRATKGFNSKEHCNARTYTYTLPTVAFTNFRQRHDRNTYRIDSDTLTKVAHTLQLYEGTKNFHNFTNHKNFIDPSAKRFIMSFTCSEPFISPHNQEFVTLRVKGQSFMLHQIRKMVGMAIAIVRDHTTAAMLERAMTDERIDVPTAPGLGLVLDTVHYERYNNRYGDDGIHEPLTWDEEEEEITEFIEKYINANIYKTECEEDSIGQWLAKLYGHTYDPITTEEALKTTTTNGSDSNDKHNDDDGEE